MKNSFYVELFLHFPLVIEGSSLALACTPSLCVAGMSLCLCIFRVNPVWVSFWEVGVFQPADWSTRAPKFVVFPQIGDLPIPFGQNNREVPWPWLDTSPWFLSWNQPSIILYSINSLGQLGKLSFSPFYKLSTLHLPTLHFIVSSN